jgi:hypothetical protein
MLLAFVACVFFNSAFGLSDFGGWVVVAIVMLLILAIRAIFTHLQQQKAIKELLEQQLKGKHNP